LPKCKFTTKYYDYEIRKEVDFKCPEKESFASGFCIFHDKDYLQDKTNYEEHKRKILDRLKQKVNHAIAYNEPLLCICFQLPEFSLSDLSIDKKFTRSLYFNGSQFFGEAFFARAQLHGQANFSEAKFQEVSFYGAHLLRLADFGTANF
jgi:Pentapeptide repeats (9 copies)